MATPVKVHYCFQQTLGEVQPPRRCQAKCKKRGKLCSCKKCKCRQLISLSEATLRVKTGEAQWIIADSVVTKFDQVCRWCNADPTLKKSCANCKKTGVVAIYGVCPIPSNDIVMVTTACEEEGGKQVYRSVVAKQTPRVATIEAAHIIRAYVNENEEEQQRIEAYGELNKEFFVGLMAPFQDDPTDGRLLFPFGPDQRSISTYWR